MKNTDQTNYDGYSKYDKIVSQTYEKSRQFEKHWHEENKFIETYLKNNKVNKLLDIPVGTGRFFQYYGNVNSVIGLDISEDMLDEAKKKLDISFYNVPINLELGDIFSLHFKDKEFDSAIVFRLFHLMPEASLSLAIKELCRVVNNDILVQSYVPINGFYQFRQKLINRLGLNASVAKTEEAETPWSHIQSYCHKQSLLNDEFKKHNFFPSSYKCLDIYGNCEVRATIYSKKN